MKIVGILFFLFGLMSLGLAIAMLVDKALLNQFDPTVRNVFIGLLFVYGAYRLWSAIGAIRRASQRRADAR